MSFLRIFFISYLLVAQAHRALSPAACCPMSPSRSVVRRSVVQQSVQVADDRHSSAARVEKRVQVSINHRIITSNVKLTKDSYNESETKQNAVQRRL